MPAYPLLARPVFHVFRSRSFAPFIRYPKELALLVTAQLFAVMAWTYLILLMRRFAVAPFLIALSIVMILAQPFSFIMVWGYTESLFLAAVTGLLFWITKPMQLRYGLVMQAHAFVASAARMHGLALLLIPLLMGLASVAKGVGRSDRLCRAVYYGSITLSALSGAVVHFSYLYWKFGDWLLYFHSQMEGWGHEGIGVLGVLNWRIYRPWWRLFATGQSPGNWINLTGIIVPVFTVLCICMLVGSLVLLFRRQSEAISGAVALFVYGMLYLTLVGAGRLIHVGLSAPGLTRYQYVMMFLLFPFLIIQIRALLPKTLQLFLYGVFGLLIIPLIFYHFYVLDLVVNHNLAI